MPDKPFYTPSEIAEILQVSIDTIHRRFAAMPGVINLGSEGSISRRRYRTLRIPREVLQKFLLQNRIAA
jgi:hypothetical protein